MTLAALRTLLTLAHGAHVERLAATTDPAFGVTPRAVAWHFLTRHIMMQGASGSWFLPDLMTHFDGRGDRQLDLTDPGTVHALKVALALALGLDPGPMGVGASWRPRLRVESNVWSLHTTTGFESFVINEPEPIKALVIACQCVIKGKS